MTATDTQTYGWSEAHKIQHGLPSFRRVDRWSRLGALKPQPIELGSGNQRYWTRRELRKLAALQVASDDLAGLGFTHIPVALVARCWEALDTTNWTIVNSGGVRIIVQFTAEDGSSPIAVAVRNSLAGPQP